MARRWNLLSCAEPIPAAIHDPRLSTGGRVSAGYRLHDETHAGSVRRHAQQACPASTRKIQCNSER